MANTDNIDSLIYGDKGKKQNQSLSNQLRCLEQVTYFGVKGTYTIDSIPRSDIPKGQDIKYANFDCDYRPMKYEPY